MTKRRESPEARIVGGLLRGIGRLLGLSEKGGSRRSGGVIDRRMVSERWMEVENLAREAGASRLRSAIVEADKLLDYALRGRGFPGETMGDRLRAAKNSFSRDGYDSAWQAHKLRNRYVHELDADVLHWEVKDGLIKFQKALRELGVL